MKRLFLKKTEKYCHPYLLVGEGKSCLTETHLSSSVACLLAFCCALLRLFSAVSHWPWHFKGVINSCLLFLKEYYII